MGFIENFKKGRDAAYEKRGRAERLAAKRARLERSPVSDDQAAEETKDQPIDETKELLAELVAQCEELKQRNEELETGLKQRDGELNEKKQLLTEIAAQCEQLQEERDRLAEALQVPGAREVLLKLTHPDRYPNATDEQLRVLTESCAKINAAYELIDRQAENRRDAA